MKSLLPATLALLFSYLFLFTVGVVAYTVFTAPMATHFNGAGEVNGWMTRNENALFLLLIGTLPPGVIILTFFLIGRPRTLRLNNHGRRYEVPAEKMPELRNFLLGTGLWLASLIVLFMGGVEIVLMLSNSHPDPSLSGPALGVVLVLFLIGIGAFVIRTLVYFNRFMASR